MTEIKYSARDHRMGFILQSNGCCKILEKAEAICVFIYKFKYSVSFMFSFHLRLEKF